MLKQLLCFGFVAGLTIGCGNTQHNKSNDVKASNEINESFSVKKASKNATVALKNAFGQSEYIVGMTRAALDKEFLFQGSLITQSPLPMFKGLKSRIVAFKEVGDTLYMLEATQGHTVSHSLPQEFVIAAFPILSHTNETIYFDFSQGLNKVYTAPDWHGQDFSGSSYQDTWTSIDLSISYLSHAAVAENQLVVHQTGQLSTSVGETKSNLPVQMRYYISPYEPSPNFLSTRTTTKIFDHFGFFEVAPQHQVSGPDLVYASKFDHSKPISFGISANTPVAYKQAVRDGILYWNQAFGREILQVIDLPEGVSAPDYRNNIVQWVSWDDAGFAYADAQMDPRTGEIKHAQIFMTSAFAFGGLSRARNILRNLQGQPSTSESEVVSLVGFTRSNLCHYEPKKQLQATIEGVLANIENLDDEMMLKISQDYIREVVAHEVGHTLGLRHNFAGSLAMNFAQSDKAEIFAQYIKNRQAPDDIITSSSVMEYQRFEEGVLTGDQIARQSGALTHDQQAIQVLYENKFPEQPALFCTDSHVESHMDCNRFDSGPSMLEFWVWQQNQFFESLPNLLMERYINSKSPLAGYEPTSLAEMTMNPSQAASMALQSRIGAIQSLQPGQMLIRVRRQYESINQFTRGLVTASEEQQIIDDFAKYDVFEKLLKPTNSIDLTGIRTSFERLLDHPAYESGIGAGGSPYTFTPSDKKVMREQTAMFFDYLGLILVKTELDIYAFATKNISANTVGQKLFELYVEKAHNIVLSVSGTKTATIAGVEVQLPTFKFPTSMRLKAASLLLSRWTATEWSLYERALLRKELNNILDASIGQPLGSLLLEDQSNREVARWILDNRAVLSQLSSSSMLSQ